MRGRRRIIAWADAQTLALYCRSSPIENEARESTPHLATICGCIETAKDGVRYKNGRTMPISAKRLMAASRIKGIRPSYILSSSMVASGQVRPDNVAAHHIVAAGDRRAVRSQNRLFGWHISINDTDNGVFLPRFKSTAVETLPNAIKHSGLHTEHYHLEVFARLSQVPRDFEHHERGRLVLRTIKQELIDGVFPFRKEA